MAKATSGFTMACPEKWKTLAFVAPGCNYFYFIFWNDGPGSIILNGIHLCRQKVNDKCCPWTRQLPAKAIYSSERDKNEIRFAVPAIFQHIRFELILQEIVMWLRRNSPFSSFSISRVPGLLVRQGWSSLFTGGSANGWTGSDTDSG
jgi:hypothetical protein